ncbi:MAG TPA: PD-(D/E)XK nuclease family protein [Candidatus Udaeobacter sp.]|nr:PD-(D/E)XK nuclease family protein [Candidatus Udaeobacter sp.]
MKRSRPVLLVVPSLQEAWEDVIAPWFDQVLPGAWQRELPALVVVPTRGQANDLKARLIAKGSSHLGLQFVTPSSLRALLARDDTTPAAEPEHLRLVLAIAASEMEDWPNESEALAARAVARAPALLLRALDRLETAGWKFEELGVPSFAPVVQRFNELLKKCDFVLSGETDRRRLQQAARGRREFSHVLITGFDGARWTEWFLLRTAVELAENATIVLEEPRENFSDVDLCWIGSWEEVCGEAQRAGRATTALGDSLFSEMEMRGGAETKRFDFLIGTNFSEQAEAITRQCIRYLADEKCARLGVIFPRSGALPRLVANSLERLKIPHNDGLGHIVPGIFESAEWQAWIELQRAPRLNSFLCFLNALPDPAVVSPKISRQVFEKILHESYMEVLLDDLELLREFCATHVDDKSQSTAEALRALPFLPPRATLAQFLERTHAALAHLDWKQHALELANIARDWSQHLDAKFSRALFLRWLEETAATSDAARSAAGDHPYARVQLLTVARAQNQGWSHLILAGWNEGAWPPPAGAEFARAEEIRAFNHSVQQLNKRAARQGSQGEGHSSVRENHSLYLGPGEQRAIALRQFDALLESASEAVTLAASLVQEDAPERFWNPSECFTELYLKTRGEPLTQTTLKNLQRATALLPKPAALATDVQQTLIAFNTRRDSSQPAGEYDFALRPNESYRPVPKLSVSDLERMVLSPAIIWMKRYLGVEAPEDAATPWAATTGKWVHDWLANIIETRDERIFSAFPSLTRINRRIRLAADERCAALRRLCDLAGKVVPDWWYSGWLNARYLARHLGAKIGGAKGWDWMATELAVGRERAVKIADGVELQLRGQIDLVLAQNDAVSFTGQKIWIVDYKTGSTKELKTSDLHDNLVKGTTLQLGLYALAMRELGATEVSVSIISLAVKNVAPQLSVVDLAPHTDVFADLAEMQRTGVFGMKGEIRPGFGYSTPYPLATLQIDNDILEDKWALTHPALVLEKEEWEIW